MAREQLEKKIQHQQERDKAKAEAHDEADRRFQQSDYLGWIVSNLKVIGLELFDVDAEGNENLPEISFGNTLGRVKNNAEQPPVHPA